VARGGPKPSRVTLENREKLLVEISETGGNVSRACQNLGIERRNVYRWVESNKEFAEAFERAQQLGLKRLEDEARRRAFEGVDKAITYQGEITATVKEYSDTLMIFLLKGGMPEKYKDQTRTEIVGDGGGPLVFSSRAEEDKRLAALLGKVNAGAT